MTRTTFPILVAVIVGYLLLLTASLVYLGTPWNFVVAGVILFKGLIFAAVVARANSVGRKQVPPRS